MFYPIEESDLINMLNKYVPNPWKKEEYKYSGMMPENFINNEIKIDTNLIHGFSSKYRFVYGEMPFGPFDHEDTRKYSSGCFNLVEDTIHIKPKERFRDEACFLSVFFHEMIHWTGFPDRCNRMTLSSPDRSHGAVEEITAEIGSFLLMNHFKKSTDESIDKSLYYIKSYVDLFNESSKSMSLTLGYGFAIEASEYIIENVYGE